MKPVLSQGIVLVSMFTNAAGLYTCGAAFDRGARAVMLNLGVTLIGTGTGAAPAALGPAERLQRAAAGQGGAAERGLIGPPQRAHRPPHFR